MEERLDKFDTTFFLSELRITDSNLKQIARLLPRALQEELDKQIGSI